MIKHMNTNRMTRLIMLCLLVSTSLQVLAQKKAPTDSKTATSPVKTKALKGLAAAPANAQQGLEVRQYSLGALVPTLLPELAKGQLPNRITKAPAPVLADYLNNINWPKEDGIYQHISGYLLIKESRSYNFTLRHTGHADFSLDGQLMLAHGVNDGVGEKDAEVFLEAGYHKLDIRHADRPGKYKEVTLWWFNNEKKEKEYVPVGISVYVPGSQETTAVKAKMMAGLNEIVPGDGSPLDELHPSVAVKPLHKVNLKPAVGGMDFMTNGTLVVSTWDSIGQVYLLKNATTGDTNKIAIKRIAMGLAEPLGLKVVADRIFVLQKQELTELIDLDGDEVIDEYRTICNGWGTTGNFHEFAFGLVYRDGFFYATLATAIMPGGKSAHPQNKDRGKVIKIGLDGRFEFVASGLRTPNGIGEGTDRELFVADNQGDWLPACKIVHVRKDAFYGNFSVEPFKMGVAKVMPPAVWLPQGEIGNSTTQPVQLNWGPFKNQMLVGDVHYGGLQRVYLEKVNDEYQGAVFKFSQGLMGGTNRLQWGPDGQLYIGMVGSTGNWGQYGKAWYGLQQMTLKNYNAFEMKSISLRSNGLEVEFTQPLAAGTGNKVTDYDLTHWRYVPTSNYGGPKVDEEPLTIQAITLSKDRKKAFLHIDGLKADRVIYVHLKRNRFSSEDGQKLWSTDGWYTLNYLSEQDGPQLKAKAAPVATVSTTKDAKPAAKPVAKPTAPALDGLALVESSGCRGCHANDKMGLGPSFKAVATKYKGEKRAAEFLTNKVLNGGSGVWGEQAMPTHHHIGKAKVEAMVKWVLTLE